MTVAVNCVPARFTPVTVAVTSGSATPRVFTKFVTVDEADKPEPLIVMVFAAAPIPTPLVPVAYVIDVIEGATPTASGNAGATEVAP